MVRDPQNLCQTTRTFHPVVRYTTEISSPQNFNKNMPKNLNNRCHWLSPFLRNKTCVRNHEWHAFLRSRLIFIHVVVYKINNVGTHNAHEKIISRFTSVVVVRTTKKIVGLPDPLSWGSCGPLLIKVCVNPWKMIDKMKKLLRNLTTSWMIIDKNKNMIWPWPWCEINVEFRYISSNK